MKKKLLIILILSFGCKTNNSSGHTIEKVSVSGEIRNIKIPKNEIFKEGVYDEVQAARIIYLNISESLKERISLKHVQILISFQGEFIIVNQNANIEYELLSDKNIEFLKKKSDSKNLNLTREEIIKIFEIDNYYAKLINIIE